MPVANSPFRFENAHFDASQPITRPYYPVQDFYPGHVPPYYYPFIGCSPRQKDEYSLACIGQLTIGEHSFS